MKLIFKNIVAWNLLGWVAVFLLAGCGPKARKAGGYMDTPEFHYEQGMKYYNSGEFAKAESEFNLGKSLDAKYGPSYAGLGLCAAERKEFSKAYELVDKAKSLTDDKFAPAYIAHGIIITKEKAGGKDEDWLEDAIKQFDKALKIDPSSLEAMYRKGFCFKMAYKFTEAAVEFKKVLELDKDMASEWAKHSDEQWKIVQDIERAAPGTKVGKKIALVEKLSRADVAALFISELDATNLIAKKRPKNYDTDFKAPTDSRTMNVQGAKMAAVTDMGGHWAENFVNDVLGLQIRGLEAYPDHTFHPQDLITRGEYAFMLEDILIAILRDESLATKHFGSTTSRFPDVNPSSPYYNAICNMVDKNIMDAQIDGEFGAGKSVAGPEALLVIRKLKELKR